MVMAFAPTAKAILPDAEPDVTATPFTFTVAVALLVVGVTVIEATELATSAV